MTLAVLKLTHLFHSTYDFLLVFDDLGLVVRLVDDLNGGHVSVVHLVILELNIVREQEVQKPAFLILGQLAEDKCLRLWCLRWSFEWRMTSCFVLELLLCSYIFMLAGANSFPSRLAVGTFTITHLL